MSEPMDCRKETVSFGLKFATLSHTSSCREGVQKNSVRNCVAEMANNLWATKYPAFGEQSVVKLSRDVHR